MVTASTADRTTSTFTVSVTALSNQVAEQAAEPVMVTESVTAADTDPLFDQR